MRNTSRASFIKEVDVKDKLLSHNLKFSNLLLKLMFHLHGPREISSANASDDGFDEEEDDEETEEEEDDETGIGEDEEEATHNDKAADA
ncbi:uncharacterized protein LOC131168403 [Malania oleifera]|uniref:uncharacterized protein LOC131168403 n=1 Tax=Malania oleifera TaxID=397392 RepID=UPI0025ADD431|nr:uncharacterized protein LOC131168403 [Malania oleifera]